MPITTPSPTWSANSNFSARPTTTPKSSPAPRSASSTNRATSALWTCSRRKKPAVNRRYFDALMDQAKAHGHNSYSINGWHRHCRGIYDLLHEPRILDYVEDLLGPNLVSVMTHYFCKEPANKNKSSGTKTPRTGR